MTFFFHWILRFFCQWVLEKPQSVISSRERSNKHIHSCFSILYPSLITLKFLPLSSRIKEKFNTQQQYLNRLYIYTSKEEKLNNVKIIHRLLAATCNERKKKQQAKSKKIELSSEAQLFDKPWRMRIPTFLQDKKKKNTKLENSLGGGARA